MCNIDFFFFTDTKVVIKFIKLMKWQGEQTEVPEVDHDQALMSTANILFSPEPWCAPNIMVLILYSEVVV